MVRIMRDVMIVQMLQKFRPRLQGKLPGRKDYARLCELLSEAPPGSVVFLDFAGVELASGSWINAALVPLLAWANEEGIDLFPVICNANKDLVEELLLVARY